MKTLQLFFCLLFLAFTPSSDKEKIKTLITHNGQHKEGHIILETYEALCPKIHFKVSDAPVNAVLNRLSAPCKHLIGMGFLSPYELDNAIQSMDLKLQRSNPRFKTYIRNHTFDIELVKNNESDLLIGASVSSANQVSEKIIFKYSKHKLAECQLRITNKSIENTVNLQFYSHE